MSKEALIESAMQILVPDPCISRSLNEKSASMAQALTRQMEKRIDLEDLIGHGNQTVLTRRNGSIHG